MPVFRDDPYGAYNFLVEVRDIAEDGTDVRASFTEVSGLEVEVTPIEYRNGSEDITPRKIPGLKKFTNLTLKRGIIGDIAFWNWILDSMRGQVNRRDMSIKLLDENRQEVMRWDFVRAWPTKYSGPTLNAHNNEVAMETLEIAHEGFRIDGDG